MNESWLPPKSIVDCSRTLTSKSKRVLSCHEVMGRVSVKANLDDDSKRARLKTQGYSSSEFHKFTLGPAAACTFTKDTSSSQANAVFLLDDFTQPIFQEPLSVTHSFLPTTEEWYDHLGWTNFDDKSLSATDLIFSPDSQDVILDAHHAYHCPNTINSITEESTGLTSRLSNISFSRC